MPKDNPEINQKIDEYIAQNPETTEWANNLVHDDPERAVRKLILTKIEEEERIAKDQKSKKEYFKARDEVVFELLNDPENKDIRAKAEERYGPLPDDVINPSKTTKRQLEYAAIKLEDRVDLKELTKQRRDSKQGHTATV